MFNRYWKNRAARAEAERDHLIAMLKEAEEHLQGIELRLLERAVLTSITKHGRSLRFIFARNNHVFTIDAMGTWDDNVEQWKRDLLEPLKD